MIHSTPWFQWNSLQCVPGKSGLNQKYAFIKILTKFRKDFIKFEICVFFNQCVFLGESGYTGNTVCGPEKEGQAIFGSAYCTL